MSLWKETDHSGHMQTAGPHSFLFSSFSFSFPWLFTLAASSWLHRDSVWSSSQPSAFKHRQMQADFQMLLDIWLSDGEGLRPASVYNVKLWCVHRLSRFCKLSDGGRQSALLTAVYTSGGSFMYNKNKSDLIALEFISQLHFMWFCTSVRGFVCRFCFLTWTKWFQN